MHVFNVLLHLLDDARDVFVERNSQGNLASQVAAWDGEEALSPASNIRHTWVVGKDGLAIVATG